MQKSSYFLPFFILSVLSLGFFSQTQAAGIENINVTADDDYINFLWDDIAANTLSDTDGYALQWSGQQSLVKITKPANLYEGKVTGKSLRRNSFQNNTYYYLRIYTYTEENNKKYISNGSQMLKWKVDHFDNVEKSSISVSDPVIINSSSDDNGGVPDGEFSTLRVITLDTFANFAWSRPAKLASSDYDGFLVKISKKSNGDEEVGVLDIDKQKYAVRVKGLDPNTQYYAQGFFYKERGSEKVEYGKGPVRAFRTIHTVPRDGSTAASRNLLKLERRAAYSINIGDATDIVAEEETTGVDLTDKTQIRKKIADLKARIKKLQSELNRWESKLGIKPTPTTTRTTTRTTQKRSTGLSIRERLRLILQKKRNN